MAAVLAERMDRLLDWQLVLQLQIREIESRHLRIHEELIDWGRWGRGIGAPAEIARAGIWTLPGEYDPDLDPDAAPESPAPRWNEKRVLELDEAIGNLANFPAVWRRVLGINYVGARKRAGFYVVLPEWQRHDAARVGSDSYRRFLSESLRHLENA